MLLSDCSLFLVFTLKCFWILLLCRFATLIRGDFKHQARTSECAHGHCKFKLTRGEKFIVIRFVCVCRGHNTHRTPHMFYILRYLCLFDISLLAIWSSRVFLFGNFICITVVQSRKSNIVLKIMCTFQN